MTVNMGHKAKSIRCPSEKIIGVSRDDPSITLDVLRIFPQIVVHRYPTIHNILLQMDQLEQESQELCAEVANPRSTLDCNNAAKEALMAHLEQMPSTPLHTPVIYVPYVF
ncbi:hypothetical protein RYX36_013511 [Vicia faba]